MRNEFIKKDEAIKLLRLGWEIFTLRNESREKRGQVVYSSLTYVLSYPNEEDKYIHSSTINALKRDEIIQKHSPYHLIN